MKELLMQGWLVVVGLYCCLHLLIYAFSRNWGVIEQDLKVWKKQYELSVSGFALLAYLLWWHHEFRNLFYYRVKPYDRLLNFLLPKLSSLYLNAKSIGPGFFIQHGDSSRINGEAIGSNCWVNQLVTIAYSNRNDRPVLKDGVRVHVGAVIIGKVTIGENSVIGAGAVVIKNVPANCTVVGSYPAYIVRENGMRVKKPL